MALSRTLLAALCVLPAASAAISFNRDIRPIMADTCFRCHGPDKNSRMANLRLDLREEAVKPRRNGAAPIVPGDPGASLIVKRIFSENPALLMPPKAAHKDLSPAQRNTIRQWVQEGAVYEGHWAYQPVQRPPVPEAKWKDRVRNPIDAFVQARLAGTKLEPAPEADKRTLLRRVSLDLTGIPPTPAEIEAFENDTASDAYAKVVNRLMASDRYAEKQAMLWLDAVRYADTCGFHGDNAFPAWPFRDYVLRSIRDNLPFDQFTREQLAGDLLPDADDRTRTASAFNRLTRTSAEGGLQPKEYLAKYGADRVRTLSSVWLGSTMGCAECHDHKFDPFLARDFYSMKAFFADIRETGLVPDQGEKAWGDQLMLPDAVQKERWESIAANLAKTRQALSAKRVELGAAKAFEWEKALLERFRRGDLDWNVQRPVKATSRGGATLRIYNDEALLGVFDRGGSVISEAAPGNGMIVAEGMVPDRDAYIVDLRPGAGVWASLGLEVISDDRLPGARLARGSDRLVVSAVEAFSGNSKLRFSGARSNMTFWDAGLTPWGAIDDDPNTAWGAATYRTFRTAFLALDLADPLTTGADSVIRVVVRNDSKFRRAQPGRFRIALARDRAAQPVADREAKPTVAGMSPELVKAIETPAEDRTEAQWELTGDLVDSTHEALTPAWAALMRAEADRVVLREEIPRVVATVSVEPEPTRILARGNFLDESGDVVQPAIPAFLGKLETGGKRATRLDLANWLVDKNNPLTARAYANRTWRQLFGTGLSKVLEDLGSQGEWPTHPELLDWLAAEFMTPSWEPAGAHSWDMRHLVRTIVMSHAYRQSSSPSPAALQADPENRLLARQSRYRVEAEVVRDIALSVSGLLAEKFGGPSVKPYQPRGYLVALNFPRRDYSESWGEDLYRRGLYTFWQRTFLHPSIAAFDAPTREECTVNRTSSNTPLQSLVLLNDPIYVEAARVFGQNMVARGGKSPAERIAWGFRQAVGRTPTTEETGVLAELYRNNLDRYQTAPAEARKLVSAGEYPIAVNGEPADIAASITVARAILNLHETITRN
ncbi:MAG: PSD1 and planctomycete cytochrome C domain-containing protein [Bryobacteraceae bacterium]